MQGDLLLVMAGDSYWGPPMGRVTLNARFGVQVSNVVGGGVSLSIYIEHRNSEDTAWTTAGTFTAITALGSYALVINGLKEWVRYCYKFTAGSSSDGMYVYSSMPQWLRD